MAQHSRQSSIVAGLFLLAGIAVLIGVSFVLADVELGSKRDYVVRFSLAEGVPGIESGSAVTIGGLRVGRVRRVELFPPGPGAPESVDVLIRIDEDVRLHEGTVALLEQPVLGGLSTIDIPRVGTADGGVELLEEGGVIDGRIPPPRFLRQAGFDATQQEQLKSVIDNADKLVTRLNDLTSRVSRVVDRVEPELGPAVEDARAAVEDLRAIVGDVRARQEEWMGRLDAVLADAERFAGGLEPALDEARAGIDEARGVVADVDAAINRNRAPIDAMVDDLASASERLRGHTLPSVEEFVSKLGEQVESLEATVERIDSFVAEQEPSLRRTLANLRLSSDQLKLAMVEIRAQPWRLLVRPKTRQLEQELVYDAARAYAEAVGDLRAASESLESTLARRRGSRSLTDDPARIERIAGELDEAFERYQQTEQELLDRLIGSGQ